MSIFKHKKIKQFHDERQKVMTVGIGLTTAKIIQANNLSTIEWTDDLVVYGKDEDWRVPKPNAFGIKQDDCDGFMSNAMNAIRKFPKEVPEYIFKKYGTSYLQYKDWNLDPVSIGLFYVLVEKEEGNNTDGTSKRGGHAILCILDKTGKDAWVIDNRQLSYKNIDFLTQEQADYLNSHSFPYWFAERNPFGKDFVEADTPKVSDIFKENDIDKSYLFLSGKCLGDSKHCQDWTIWQSPEWEWMAPIIEKSQKQARKENLL